MNKTIVSIGGGNMGRAILGGLIADGYDPSLLLGVDPQAEAREQLARELGLTTAAGVDSLDRFDIVILAVKPQIMRAVVSELAPLVGDHRPLFISIAAGVTTDQLDNWLGGSQSIIRVMPNTPALVGAGAAAMFATQNVAANEREAAQAILSAVGVAVWVERENELDAVTALSGSGPAYFFLMLEILEKVAVELGLAATTARQLAIETAHGAALLARGSEHSPAILREQVTSPGGTTERALGILRDGRLETIFRDALVGAAERSRELSAGPTEQ